MARNTYYQDEVVKQKFNGKQLIRVLKYALPFKYYFFGALILMLAAVLISLIPPLLQETIIDKVAPNSDYRMFLIIVICYAIIGITDTVINFFQQRMMGKTGHRIIMGMRQDIFEHIQSLPLSYFDSRPSGKIVVRVTSYLNEVANFFANTLLNFIVCLLRIFIVVAFMFAVNFKLTLVVLAVLAPTFICFTLIRMKTQKLLRVTLAKEANKTSYIVESIMGVKEIKSFNRSRFNTDVYKTVYNESLVWWKKVVLFNNLQGLTFNFFWHVGTVILYVVSLGLISTGEIMAGTVVAFMSYMSLVNDPFNALTDIMQQFATVSSNLERVFETLDTKSEIIEKPDAVKLENVKGDISFSDVSFAYDPGINVIEHLNLDIKAGENIALVGATGCGKSTIIGMLSRFYDVSGGNVKIDGVDVKDCTVKSLRQNIGVIMQDPFIFKDTVLENIRYGKPGASDEECIAAAKEILADKFIEKLPNGFNTMLAERGEGLSSGEKQIISFARIVLKDPAVFIFDEATSAIDSETEEMIQNSLEKIMEGRTAIMVAHRLSTIKKCNRIYYIADKNIAEQGSHEELLKKHGLYYELCKNQ